MSTLAPERLLERLDPDQRAAVTHDATTLRILAGAGSGKTRVLTHRIAYRAASGDVDPRRVLALTFTRKAASELTHRLRALGLRDTVAAGTFHAIAYAQLRSWWAERDVAPPTLLDRKVGFVARLLPRGGRTGPARGGDTAALDAVAEIEWAKARDIRPEGYALASRVADRRPPFDPDVMADLYARYEKAKTERRMVDFDDLLSRCRRALETDERFATAQRWRFRHVFVDEFQDVNPLQLGLLRAWLAEPPDLCVVGDPNQAIYSWNGADARYLVDFAREFPGAATVQLLRNYRSQPRVLAVADAVLAGGRLAAGRLQAQLPDGPLPTIAAYPNDRAEAAGVARAVREQHRPGGRWAEQAVLARTNAQLPVLEQALRKAGVPVRLRGGGLLAAPEVEAALRRIARRTDALVVVLDDLADELDLRRAGHVDDGRDAAGAGASGALFEADDVEPDPGDAADDEAGGASDGGESRADAERRANLEALLRMGRDYAAVDPAATGVTFVAWARATAARDGDDAATDAVELLTFHAAKGLEWPVVHLVGLEQGLVPISHAKSDEARAEEDRLLYVAVTRAQRVLRLSWAQERTFGDRRTSRNPSPQLARVESVLTFLRTGVRPSDNVRHARDTRSTVRAGRGGAGARAGARATAGDADPALLAALKSWRSSTARAANVPAYVVFNDATLEAVASCRPTTKTALASVPGIGPVKLERYGETLLELVRDNAG